MKITTGIYNFKKIHTLKNHKLRPTSNKIRNAVFNILVNKYMMSNWSAKAHLLDAFSGSGIIDLHIIKKIEKGLIINKLKYGVKSIKIISTTRSYSWVLIKLDEGKNNHIRKIFKRLGFSVNKLIRIQYGPIKLSSLKPGDLKLISPFKLNLINL